MLITFHLADRFLYLNEECCLVMHPAVSSVYVWRAKSALKNLGESVDSSTTIQHHQFWPKLNHFSSDAISIVRKKTKKNTRGFKTGEVKTCIIS